MDLLKSIPSLIIAVLMLTRAVWAEESAADFLQPLVARGQYATYCNQLGLARDQQLIADMLFDDYVQMLETAVALSDARADGMGRQTVLAAIAGRERVNIDELRRMRAAVLGEYRTCINEASSQLDELLVSTRHLLNDNQIGRAGAADRWLRRTVLLQPRSIRGTSSEYAGDGVDVILLAEAASRPEGELSNVPADELSESLADYERQIDIALIEISQEDLLGRVDLRIHRLTGDREAILAAQVAALERWRRINELNNRTIERIGALADDLSRQRWIERFEDAAFPWLLAQELPDQQRAWIRSQRSIDEQQLATIQTIYEKYQQRRRALARDAIDIIIEARMQHGAIIHPLSDVREISDTRPRELYQQLLRNSGERSRLSATTSAQLEEALTADQRSAMRQTIRRRGR